MNDVTPAGYIRQSPTPILKTHPVKGIAFTLLSAFGYSLLSTVIKKHSAHIPVPVWVFFQSLIALICLILFISCHKRYRFAQIIKTQRLTGQCLRTLFSVGISYFLVLALKFIPLVDSLVLANTAPLMVILLAYFFLHHPLKPALLFALALGLTGVVCVLKPNTALFHPAAFFALGSALCAGASMLLTRELSAYDHVITSLFYYFLLSTILTSFLLLWLWHPLPKSAYLWLLCVGLLFFCIQYWLMLGLEYINAQTASMLYYTSIVFALLFNYLIFHQRIDGWSLLGTLLIVSGGIGCVRVGEHR